MDANAAALRELLPADLVFANHALMGGPVAAGRRRAAHRQGPRVGARVRDPRPTRPRRLGPRVARGRRGGHRRLGAHPRGAARGRRAGRQRPRGAAGRRCRQVPAGAARTGAGRAAPGVPARPAEPGQPGRATPVRGKRRPARGVLRPARAGRRLRGQAPAQQGRPRPLRGSARPRRARPDRRLRRLPRGAGGDRAAERPLHRRAGASPPRPRCSRCATSRSCRRSSPRPSGWSPPKRPRPASRRSSRGTLGWPRLRRAWRSAIQPAHRHLAGFESGNAGELRAKLEELLGLPEVERRELGRLARETAVELWSWKSVAERLLAFAAE